MPRVKVVKWVGSSLDDLKEMPEQVQDDTGFILDRVQRGLHHMSIKPLKGSSGVREIRVDFDSDTYRTVYVVNLGNFVYVLHVFKKKSKRGIQTPKLEMARIRARLKLAKEDAANE